MINDITVEEILKREPWQANKKCLKSLFSKASDTKILNAKDSFNKSG